MTGRVIQGSFLGGQPKLATVQPRTAPPIQAKTMVRPPGPPATIFAVRSPGPPTPAFTSRPLAAPSFAGQQGTVQRHGAGGAFAVDAGPLGLVSNGGRPLPEAVRGKMEAALGADFSGVRVHVGPQAERIGAIAFTVGSDIYFAPGRYQPDTIQGRQLLGHELAHVVQQRAGRVRNPLGAGLAVVQDRALEAEADRLGQRAATRVAAQAKLWPGAVQRSAPARLSPSRAPERSPAASTRFHGHPMTIQAQLIFDSGPPRWAPDSQQCSLCLTQMRSGHRHHCRVCGESVCDACSSQKFSVRSPQTSSGKDTGISTERVCVDCMLAKKIEMAKASSQQFSKLMALANNPRVKWQAGCWPNYSSGRITLNPARGDVFATFIFELTNAVASLTPLPRAATFATQEEYAFQIEHQEYQGSMWADDVAAEINSQQSDFQVARYYKDSQPDQQRFRLHLDQQLRGGHTQLYYGQWQKDTTKAATEIEQKTHELFSEAMMYGWSHREFERRVRMAVGTVPMGRVGAHSDNPGDRPLHDYSDEYIG